MNMATASNVGVSHKTHYARHGHASQDFIPKMLQELLFALEHPNQICQKCLTNSDLQGRGLSSDEWNKIKTASTKGYVNFDIPLVYTILRNINTTFAPPTKGWHCNAYPLQYDTTIGDDLQRCRITRNQIIHRGNTVVTDQELEDYFDQFKGIADRLETVLNKNPGEFVAKFDNLKTCCMDETTENIFLENIRDLAENAKEMEEMYLEKIKKLEERERERSDHITQLEDLKRKENETHGNHILQLESTLEELEMESKGRISQLEGTIKSLTIPGFEKVEVITPPKNITCIEGEDAMFYCEVVASKSEAKWYKNGQEVTSVHAQIESKNTTHTLSIPQATRNDSGSYTMEIGDERREAYLNVEGRIRSKGGKEVILAPHEDFENEEQNILRQYYMKKAIEHVVDLDLSRHIAIAERRLYDEEENDRMLADMRLNRQGKGFFSINCRLCGLLITDGKFLRHINRKSYIVYDKSIFGKIKRVPTERVTRFDEMKQIEKASGIECGHHWGSILVYRGCKLLALSKNSINFFDTCSRNIVKCKKWSEFPYQIDELSDYELSEYSYDNSYY